MNRPSPGSVVIALIAAVLVVGLAYKIADALKSDETRIREAVENVARYTREQDPGAVLECFDPEYHDAFGYTFPEVRRMANVLLRTSIGAAAEAEVLSIVKIDGDVAVVRVRAAGRLEFKEGKTLTLKDAGIRTNTFEVDLRRFKGTFRLTSLRPLEPREGADP